MKKQLKIPKFKKEDEERNFWNKIDLTKFFDSQDFERASFPNLKPTTRSISLRLPEFIINRAKEKANEINIPRFIDNSNGKGKAKLVGFDFVQNIDYNKGKITKQIYEQTEQAIKQGKISREQLPEIYKGLGRGISGRIERGGIGELGGIEPALKGGDLKVSEKAGFLFKPRQFLTSVSEARPDIPLKVGGQYVPRSTDELAMKAKTLIQESIETAED